MRKILLSLLIAFVAVAAFAAEDYTTNPETGNIDVIGMSSSDITENDARYLLIDCSNVPITGALITAHGSILANATASGVLTLGSTGGTHNESLSIDFEPGANYIDIDTTSGVQYLRLYGMQLQLIDSVGTGDGTLTFSHGYANIGWWASGVDYNYLEINTLVGGAGSSGVISICEGGDSKAANRMPLTSYLNPHLWISSSDATAIDRLDFWHDQDDSRAHSWAGDFKITAAGGDIIFDDENLETTGYASGKLITVAATPTLQTDPGVTGQLAIDPQFLYLCIATDVWRRISLAEWGANFIVDATANQVVDGSGNALITW